MTRKWAGIIITILATAGAGWAQGGAQSKAPGGTVLLNVSGSIESGSAQEELEGRLSLSGAWALYPMAVRWSEEFKKVHPKVQFDISAGGAGKGMTDTLAGAVDIGMVSRAIAAAEIEKGAFALAVAKDAVVPMISKKNPLASELARRGVKKETLQGIWIKTNVTTWGQVLGTDNKAPVHVYTRSDACGAADTWAAYLGGKQENLKGIGVYGDPGLGEALRKDAVGIGYNNVNFAYDAKTKKPVAGMAALPIDVNGNGAVDSNENFYVTRDSICLAIARGDYPSPPARDLYFVTKGQPEGKLLKAFLEWTLKDGQKYVEESGYVQVLPERIKEGLARIQGAK